MKKNNQLSSVRDVFTIPSIWKAIRKLQNTPAVISLHNELIGQFTVSYSGFYSLVSYFNDYPGTWTMTTDVANKRLVFTNSLGADWLPTGHYDITAFTQAVGFNLVFLQGVHIGGGPDKGKIYVSLVNTAGNFVSDVDALKINITKITY